MDGGERLPHSDLLAHQRFLERLVAHLVADPDVAEEVVQETWLRAFQSPPAHRSNLKGWLRRVARNTLYHTLRRRARTVEPWARAQLGPEPETADAKAERLELLRELHTAVERLAEPYRSVVVLHYYRDLTPREIARELDRPLNTVNSQLQRGLARLRGRLDEAKGGDRSLWVALLAPLRARDADAAPPSSPAARGFGPWPWATAGLLASSALLFFWFAGGTVEADSLAVAAEPSGASTPIELASSSDGNPTRLAVVPPGGASDTEPTLAWADVLVVDGAGAPVEGANVSVLSVAEVPNRSGAPQLVASEPGRTGEDGRASFALGDEHRLAPDQFGRKGEWAVFHVLREGFVEPQLHCLPFPPGGTRSPLQVVLEEPALTARVRVLDELGDPIAARVSIWKAPAIDRQERADGVRLLWNPRKEPTDELGRYEHSQMGSGQHHLTVEAPGFVRHSGGIEGSTDPLAPERVIVLERGCQLVGAVVDAAGRPVEGAAVWTESGVHNARTIERGLTDDLGEFALDGIPAGRAWMFAQHPEDASLLAAEAVDFSAAAPERLWVPALAKSEGLRFVARDRDGTPLAGWTLFLRLAASSGKPPWYRIVSTGEDGSARLHDCPSRDVVAELFREKAHLLAGRPALVSLADLRIGPEAHVLTLPEPPGSASLFGRVLEASGEPAQGVQLFARSAESAIFERVARTDGSGELAWDQAAPQTYELLLVQDGRGSVHTGELRIEAHAEMWRDFVLPAPVPVSISWSGPAADPRYSFELIAEQVVAGSTVSRTVWRGSGPPPADLNLFPGSYRLSVYREGRRIQEQALTAVPGTPLSIRAGDTD